MNKELDAEQMPGTPSVLRLRRLPVFLAEFVHTACRIDKPLLARIKWMASRANFDMQILASGRFGFKNIAATAMDFYGGVFWMYTRFHGSALPSNIGWKQTANATEKTGHSQEKNNFS